ncbi:MAG TPA: kynureninase [Cytophagales bacterium]|nr:kynureninase [Cytophagales bacterium]HAA22542.1 kynureninase [Cytophagales bacterium]HAP64854.1 kynureninase [Cytophagales bacterium]
MHYENTRAWAEAMDAQDSLAPFRKHFSFPQVNRQESIYFCGNSLGLQSDRSRHYVNQEMENWAQYGVEGHFHAEQPWWKYYQVIRPALAKVVGAKEQEVAAINNLTTNLHFLLVSFYRPTTERYKIIMEAGAFPSDMYAMESQVKYHGFAYEDAVVEISPREGENVLRTEDILDTIREHGESVALVMFSGLQYYTGQVFEMEKITRVGHEVGAMVGFDLAHAAGNVPLKLHAWDVDFATWCSYKYLNSGPGGVSGIFVHERYANRPDLPRFAGWWGHNEGERFMMEKGFDPMPGALGWGVSNENILTAASHRGSLELFDQAGMEALRAKSIQLTGYLQFILEGFNTEEQVFEIITPNDPQARGCQLSIFIHKGGKKLFDLLTEGGMIADWREPNVIRLAPTPMYNSFTDVHRFGELLALSLEKLLATA